jgi:predicted PurR-regulated permease PerM
MTGQIDESSREAANTRPEQTTPALWLIVLAVLVAFAYVASSVCITLVLASLLAILVDPVVTRLERIYFSRSLSAALIIILGMVSLGFLGYASYNKGIVIVESAPQYAWRIREAIRPLSRKIEKVQETTGSLTPEAAKKVAEVKIKDSSGWASYLLRGVGSVWGVVIIVGVVPFLTFFLLVRKKQMVVALSGAVGDRMNVPQFMDELNAMVRGFVAGNLIIAAVMALVTSVMLLVLHIQGAVVLGIASGLLNVIPFLGPVLASIVPLTAALLQLGSHGPFFIILATVVSLHLVATNFLIPKLVGSRVNIGPVAATVGMLFWGWLWGAMGLLLAVPLTACVKLVADAHPSLTRVSRLLAQPPSEVPQWSGATHAKVQGAAPFWRKEARDKSKD